jgi:hypothetical protein
VVTDVDVRVIASLPERAALASPRRREPTRARVSVHTALGDVKRRRVTRQARSLSPRYHEKKCIELWIARCACHAPASSTICAVL